MPLSHRSWSTALLIAALPIATSITAACDRPTPERTGVVQQAVEETSESGTDELVFTDPDVRAAVDDYVAVLSEMSSPEEQAQALAAVAALDDATRTEQLANAFEETGLSQKWMVLFVMSKVPSEGGWPSRASSSPPRCTRSSPTTSRTSGSAACTASWPRA